MSLDDIRKVREEKLEKIRRTGADPYPAGTRRTHEIGEVLENFDSFIDGRKPLVLVGRIMAKREHGGSLFVDFVDGSGQLQAYLKKDVLAEDFDFFQLTSDIGDFYEFSGIPFRTKKGEPTLEIKGFKILAKSLLPLP